MAIPPFPTLTPPRLGSQAEDRAHRIGQQQAVNIHYLVAKDTVDESMWRVLQKKVRTLAQTLDGAASRLEAKQHVWTGAGREGGEEEEERGNGSEHPQPEVGDSAIDLHAFRAQRCASSCDPLQISPYPSCYPTHPTLPYPTYTTQLCTTHPILILLYPTPTLLFSTYPTLLPPTLVLVSMSPSNAASATTCLLGRRSCPSGRRTPSVRRLALHLQASSTPGGSRPRRLSERPIAEGWRRGGWGEAAAELGRARIA